MITAFFSNIKKKVYFIAVLKMGSLQAVHKIKFKMNETIDNTIEKYVVKT